MHFTQSAVRLVHGFQCISKAFAVQGIYLEPGYFTVTFILSLYR